MMFFCITSWAEGHWEEQPDYSYKWIDDNGNYASPGWNWIDETIQGLYKCYYFDHEGKVLKGPTKSPDGYDVNVFGAWVENGNPVMKYEGPAKIVLYNDADETLKTTYPDAWAFVECGYITKDGEVKEDGRISIGNPVVYPELSAEALDELKAWAGNGWGTMGLLDPAIKKYDWSRSFRPGAGRIDSSHHDFLQNIYDNAVFG